MNYPPTAKRTVTDDYSGAKILDDYRWLDDGASAETKKWSGDQNQLARKYLDALPLRPAAESWLKALYAKVPPSYGELLNRGGRLFAMKFEPPKAQRFLVTLRSADEPAIGQTVVVDPNALDASGSTSIDWYVPSHDGKLVAVSLSKGGSEDGSVHIFETATGKQVDIVIPRVQYPTGGGSVAWNADATGFWYTRYPAPGEKPPADEHFFQQVWFHKLGTPLKQDTYAVGKEFPRIAETALQSSADGKYVLATVANGDGGDFFHFLLGPSERWKQITRLSDRASLAQFDLTDDLYLLTKSGTPLGKIVKLAAPDFQLASAKTIVTAATASIDGMLVTNTILYVSYMAGGPSKLRALRVDGTDGKMLDIRMISSVGQMVRGAGDDLLFESATYTEPRAYYRYQPATGQITKTALANDPPVSFSDIETLRVMVTSKDGAKVPLNILRKRGTKLDGSNATLLYGYGGYGISLPPSFSATRRWWFDHGGVYAIANLRGGGEFGEPWHEAGKLTKKQTVFDDFIACAEYLIKSKYTTPEKLAIEGGSNGGLSMGAALTQRPDLFRAVVAHVGIFDMLRVELFPNGAFNVTEFGTVKEKDQFKALFAYSPYHHVTDGKEYPAVLFMTGDNDGRVDPANSRKMTARLQAAQKGSNPILLRTSSGSGHGMGTALSEQVAQEADVYAFLAAQLGMK